MSIIAGEYRGISLIAPRNRTIHPMSGRMRAALFNMLGELDGLDVLDAFGGSGAIGLEALSRGARSVVIADNDPKAQRIIEQNIETINSPAVHQAKANVYSWLDNNHDKFDIIIADPPYDKIDSLNTDKLLRRLRPTGLLVISHPADYKPKLKIKRISSGSYAGGNLSFYKL